MDDTGSPSTSDDPVEQLGRLAREGLTVAVGLGILGINRVQALRRDLEARLASRMDQPDREPGDDTTK